MTRIGFVGLGHMGLPMAIHLVQAGHQVTGFDLDKTRIKALVEAGGEYAEQSLEAAQDQDILITMLQTGQQVQQVCSGEQGLLAILPSHALHIDCSSIDVATTRHIHQQAETRGIINVDAPVSGGVGGASKGTLTFMVGGTEAGFEKAKPYLQCMGKTIIHTGPSGNGQAAKICNNMILGISMIAISEAFTLGEALGLSPDKLFEVVTHASGQCWAMSQYPPLPGLVDNVPANNNYKPGFTAAMMLKDLSLSQQSAKEVGIRTHLGQAAMQIYKQFNDTAFGELDFSGIINQVKQK